MGKYMKLENNFLSEFGYNMLLDRGLEPLRKWNAVFRKFMSDNALGDVASSLAKTAKWKFIILWPKWFYRSYGTRWATPEERANFNFIRDLKAGLVDQDRLEARAKDIIGRTAKWLDSDKDRFLSPRDLWNRLRADLGISDLLDAEVLLLQGNDPTVLITQGLANALLVFRLLDEYCYELLKKRGQIQQFELADGSLFELSVAARIRGTWQCGLEAFALTSLDVEGLERSTIIAEERSSLCFYKGIDRYLGVGPYPVEKDIVLVECNCTPDIHVLVDDSKVKAIGSHLQNWRNKNPELRVPVVLELGSTCLGTQWDPVKPKRNRYDFLSCAKTSSPES
jgi:hypothetical protein